MNGKSIVPNTITLLNMLCGILSIYFGMSGDLITAAYLIFFAAILDFLDGFTARMLNAYSDLGAQLDSLADLISFGLAPGFILFNMINISHGQPGNTGNTATLIPFIGFIIPLFAALRLAKFNIDENQESSFLGMPTPAVAILIGSFPLIKQYLFNDRGLYYMIITNTYFLAGIAVIMALLMVIPLPMFAFKFKNYKWKDNKIKYVFLILSLIAILIFKSAGIPLIISMYFLLSLVFYLTDIQS
ncbi:MAG: CDP-diacylglycerol--serine O-phosphatidyltransferase [Marinilabiliales bacterium]|nr:MAG: CDP-diacylglycerol--serine O-phosphatidyltransferase [Marinilabiliales bacterium]